MIERRKARRFNVEWSIIARINGGAQFEETGTLVNLCSHGALLLLNKDPNLGRKLDLWIRLPFSDERWMKYSAEVVRIEGSSPYKIAVRFNRVRPQFADRPGSVFEQGGSHIMHIMI